MMNPNQGYESLSIFVLWSCVHFYLCSAADFNERNRSAFWTSALVPPYVIGHENIDCRQPHPSNLNILFLSRTSALRGESRPYKELWTIYRSMHPFSSRFVTPLVSIPTIFRNPRASRPTPTNQGPKQSGTCPSWDGWPGRRGKKCPRERPTYFKSKSL